MYLIIIFQALISVLTSRAILSSDEKTTLSTDSIAESIFLTQETCNYKY